VVYAEGYAAFFIPAPDPQLSVITLVLEFTLSEYYQCGTSLEAFHHSLHL